MNIVAGKDGVSMSFLLCTTPNAGAPTDSLHGLVIYTPLKPLTIKSILKSIQSPETVTFE